MQASGATVASLAAGEHEVTYAAVNGWTAPAKEKVTIKENATLELTRAYTAAPAVPTLVVEPATLTIGPNDLTGTFEVWNGGAGTLAFTVAATDGTWYTVDVADGTSTGPTNKTLVTVTVGATGAKAADATGTVTVSAVINGATSTAAVGLSKVPNYFTQAVTGGFPLGFSSLTFTPSDDSLSGYTMAVNDEVTVYPIDPAGGDIVDFTSTDVQEIELSGQLFPFYGVDYDSVFVDSYGFVTFDQLPVNTGGGQTLENHFADVRVSALTSADAGSGGEVTAKLDTEKLAITYSGVPTETGKQGSGNNFQIGLFFNGTIVLSYLDIVAEGGIIGLSNGGGLPANFVPSNLTTSYNTTSLP